ncbi:PREDICTED: coiled-coil domain-containing protein 87 [Odobenus rosmarus divergens]|uniref:Coiled-coil domain-containing protein 87 n=1 Tax=Odobenus rosmarus divergens TaxID=9708 RepID=A0A2U3VGN1_ODORO|nr:PREDICTED: coiled-coil domain-containing protein 87 [Odobenus rosmarus divergens]
MEPYKPEPELQRFYHRLLGPLSLFPRKVTRPESQKPLPPEVPMLLPLPVSRLTVASLCSQVTKRLARSGLSVRVPTESRLRFTEVILDELKCSWREPPTEPSLSHLNNQRLRKRLLAYVLLSSEQLFLRYLNLLKTMSTRRGVFTESATLTRLTASLARDCTIFLTSPEVYRCLLADFLTLLKVEQAHGGMHKLRPVSPTGAFRLYPIPWLHSTSFAQVPSSNLNLNYLIQLSRPREFLSEPELDPVKELKSIPQLKRKKPLQWLSSMQKKRESNFSSAQIVSLPKYSVTPTSRAPSTSPRLPLYSQLQRGHSMPSLCKGWKLADELGLPPLPPRPLTPLVLVPESKTKLAGDTVAEDLKQMIKNMKLERTHYSPLDSGLPPLLGALTRRPAAAHRMQELQRMLKSLEEEEATGQWGLQCPKSFLLQPQPVTVTLKLRNQAVVQAAAVQISERNFLDSFHVDGAGVLYNHLAGELEPKLIEEMDIDCFVGNNIREVYKELMSRVSLDHFSFDQGPLVEPAANKDWSAFLSSAFLRQEKQYRIINPKLAGLYSQGANILQSCDKAASLTSLQASKGWEKWSNKISWMNWWKTTLSVDDYFKYLTSQETDFLHVIFQMYEEEVPVETIAPVRKSLKIQYPPPLLEDEEPDFVPGEWDWNTVLGHSLGNKRISLLGEPCKILSLQKRLERLWSMLEVPHKDRLDLAIKYSSNARLRQLPSLVSAWEQTLKPIQLREILLGRLEWFERQASDPNRFFQKTDMGLSRFLEENQFRNRLHRKINLVQAPLASLLEEIELIFGEPVTFKGRRYLDKMKHDKVEMLYRLQQRQRVRHLTQGQKASHQPRLFKKLSSQPLITPGNTPVTL